MTTAPTPPESFETMVDGIIEDLYTSTHSGKYIRAVIEHADDDDPDYIDALDFFDVKAALLAAHQASINGETSDGYHTFNELYEYRMLYNAMAFNVMDNEGIIDGVKSIRHSDGELCFGGGWFIVSAELPTGQISNHYEMKDWDLFHLREVEIGPEWDGHTPQEAAKRLRDYLNPALPPTPEEGDK